MQFFSFKWTNMTTALFPLLGALTTLPANATEHQSHASQQNQITEKLLILEKNANGRLGAVLINTANHSIIAYRGNERFPLCSTSKFMVVSALLKQSETSDHLLNQQVHYQQSDLVEYSPITEKHLKNGMTLGELSSATLQYSDNTAMNLILDALGGPNEITKFARTIGDKHFRLDRKEPELNTAIPNDERDTSTPQSMADSLYHLALGHALALEQRNQLVEWIKGNTTGATSIRAGVPKNWVVGDKTGRCDYGSTNDIAVIWPENNRPPLVLVTYFTQPNDKNAVARPDILAETARIMIQNSETE
ncbi:class A beta-lactamase [Xenorhabdus sp. ZM]|uniref:class A beta-lactamase n=1 Tax=Xenorhabdus szentirmaii TaxID=290112 RepID=UPI0019B566B4|nr:class A beta-lactamase [Xenorhabdus sp. ZM]